MAPTVAGRTWRVEPFLKPILVRPRAFVEARRAVVLLIDGEIELRVLLLHVPQQCCAYSTALLLGYFLLPSYCAR